MKTIFITGSTDGIGKSAALQLAQLNHHLILHGRNSEKLRATIEEIKLKSKNQNVTGFLADLGDLEQTKRLASEISNAHSHIDVLINNAGVWHSKQEKDTNNLDMRFVVNYLSPLVLTNMLLPLLKKSDNPLLLNLSSAAQSRVSLQALIGMQSVSVGEAYAQSKLALTMWTGRLREEEPKITSFAINPGSLLNTKMVQEAFGRHLASVDKGADILVHFATSSELSTEEQIYFDNDSGGFGPAHKDAYDEHRIEALMNTTKHMLEENLRSLPKGSL